MQVARVPGNPENLVIALQPGERSFLLCCPPGWSGQDALVMPAGPLPFALCASGIPPLEVSDCEVRRFAEVAGMP